MAAILKMAAILNLKMLNLVTLTLKTLEKAITQDNRFRKKEICLNIPNMIFEVATILKNGRHFEIVKRFMGTPSKLISLYNNYIQN